MCIDLRHACWPCGSGHGTASDGGSRVGWAEWETIKTWNKDPASKPDGWLVLAGVRGDVWLEHIFGTDFYSLHVRPCALPTPPRRGGFSLSRQFLVSGFAFLPRPYVCMCLSTSLYLFSFPPALPLMDYMSQSLSIYPPLPSLSVSICFPHQPSVAYRVL